MILVLQIRGPFPFTAPEPLWQGWNLVCLYPFGWAQLMLEVCAVAIGGDPGSCGVLQ